MRRSHGIGAAPPSPHPGSFPGQSRSATRTHSHRTVQLRCALSCWVCVTAVVAQSPEDAVDDQGEGRPVATWPDGPTHADVYYELENSADGRAFVIVGLRPVGLQDSNLDESRRRVKDIQKRVLNKLAPGEFEIAYQYRTFAALAGRISATGLLKLEADPDVVAIGPDLVGEFFLGESVPFIRADQVHSSLGVTGTGATVAVLDSGVDAAHQDLGGDIILEGAFHFLEQGANSGPGAPDTFGHGTFTSGIITSDGNQAPKGVAPDAWILPIKVGDAASAPHSSDVCMAIDYVIENRDNYDISVMSISFGFVDIEPSYLDCCDLLHPTLTVLSSAFGEARDRGIITFAASGRDGCTGILAPACLETTVAVVSVYDAPYGNVTPNPPGGCNDADAQPDLVVCSSSRGHCNRLAAPGYNITAPMSAANVFPECPAGGSDLHS